MIQLGWNKKYSNQIIKESSDILMSSRRVKFESQINKKWYEGGHLLSCQMCISKVLLFYFSKILAILLLAKNGRYIVSCWSVAQQGNTE